MFVRLQILVSNLKSHFSNLVVTSILFTWVYHCFLIGFISFFGFISAEHFLGTTVLGDETSPGIQALNQTEPTASGAPTTPEPTDPLHLKQLSLASRFKRFEETMRKIADYTKKTDPDRAELLYRAIGKSQGAQIPLQMELIVKLLEKQSFGDAQLRQEDLISELFAILQILQSEDEQDRLKKEIARVQGLIKDVNKVIGKQKDVRAETERNGAFDEVEKKQTDVAREADQLGKKIDAEDLEKKANQDANKNNPSKNQSDSKSEKSPGNDEKNNKDQQPDGKKNDDNPEKKDSEKTETKDKQEPKKQESPQQNKSDSPQSDKPSKDGQPQDQNSKSPPSKSSPSEQPQSQEKSPPQKDQNKQQEQDNQQEQDQQNEEQKPQDKSKTPGREEIEEAHKKMEQAIEELKKQSRTQASNKQDNAIAELEKAKAKLEELLRQLREEERELKLAALEARFRRMLDMQVRVRQSTFSLSQAAQADLASRYAQRATQLSRDENEISLEADKALLIMREDGGSIAFPEAVEQMKEDMQRVTNRLLEFKLDKLTVAIEDDIIESLKEMIEALQKEQEDIKQNKQRRQQGQEPQDPELTNKLAELKMLRSLQNRINRRTRQYGEQIDGEQAVDAELVSLLKELSVRQARVQAATYALAKGKNK